MIAVGLRGVIMKYAAQVGKLDQLRQLAGLGGVDLTVAFAEFGRNPRQPERLENLCFVRGAGRRGLLIDRLEAPLAHAETAPERAMAHGDVMLLRAGEVMEGEIELLRGHDAKVRLQAILEAHAGLRLSMGGHLLHAGIGDKPIHNRLRFRRGHEEVEVADCFAGTAERSGGFGERDLRQRTQAGENRLGDRRGFVPPVALAVGDAVLDPFEDFFLGLGAETLELGDRSGLTNLRQLC